MSRRARGATSFHAGLAAEDQVAERYARAGCTIVARRWRGQGGEVDLILRDGERLIFVEVKKARDLARAAERITPRQAARLMAAAEEFAASEPHAALTEMRFDVALVDALGRIEIVENALHG